MIYQKNNSIGENFFEHIRYENFHFTIHMHRHPEFVFVRSGRLLIERNGHTEEALPGSFALIPSNCPHSYSTPDVSDVDVCIFSEDIVPAFSNEVRGKKAEKTVFTCKKSVQDFVCSEILDRDMKIDFFLLKAGLYAMLNEYLAQVSFSKMDTQNEIVTDRLIRYVTENFMENISLKTAAEALGYEEHYLSRCFHSLIPIHFSKYVNLYRVDAANELMQTSDLSISEIALESGFQSLRSFNRVYLEITGRTPRSRRKEISFPLG